MRIDVCAMGKRIRAARKMRKMSAEQLSEKIGMAAESLGHIECGNRKPSLQTLYSIAEILDVSLDYLSGRSDSWEVQLIQEFDDSSGCGLTGRQKMALQKIVEGLAPILKEYM